MADKKTELLFQVSIEDMTRGFTYDASAKEYVCLICSKIFQEGFIYAVDGAQCTAEKAAELHIQNSHGSMFNYLVNLNRQQTGLTEQQAMMLDYFYRGRSDTEISEAMGGMNLSTVRSYRFTFNKQEKQAKIFLAIMTLLKDGVQSRKETSNMSMSKDRRKELVDQFMEIKKQVGVYQIRNMKNGKVYISSNLNLAAKRNSYQGQFMNHNHVCRALQKEWDEMGADCFVYEILEELDVPKDNPFYDKKSELKKLEEKWIEKLQPFGEKGYHRKPE